MNKIEIFKALANDTRVQILEWLKDPKTHFPNASITEDGICCGQIQRKAKLSQSTVSQYLSVLQRADLIIGTRCGQWTYYKRNGKTLREFAKACKEDL